MLLLATVLGQWLDVWCHACTRAAPARSGVRGGEGWGVGTWT
jgi:hypothetical protein